MIISRKYLPGMMVACFVVLFGVNANAQSIQIEKRLENGRLLIDEFNLTIGVPKGWHIIPANDYHVVAAMSSAQNPTLEDPIITVHITPWLDGKQTADQIIQATGIRRANQLNQEALIQIAPEKLSIAGIETSVWMYVFRVGENTYLYQITAFNKGRMTYIISCWGNQKTGHEGFEIFRQWVKNDINFIDPNKDIDSFLVDKMFEADEELFGTQMKNKGLDHQEKAVKKLKGEDWLLMDLDQRMKFIAKVLTAYTKSGGKLKGPAGFYYEKLDKAISERKELLKLDLDNIFSSIVLGYEIEVKNV